MAVQFPNYVAMSSVLKRYFIYASPIGFLVGGLIGMRKKEEKSMSKWCYAFFGFLIGGISGFLMISIPSRMISAFDQGSLLIVFTMPIGAVMGVVIGWLISSKKNFYPNIFKLPQVPNPTSFKGLRIPLAS